MNAIPCLSWVKRGVAKKNPDKVRDGTSLDELRSAGGEFDEDDVAALNLDDDDDEDEEWETDEEGEDEDQAEDDIKKDDINEKYNLSDYDNDEEEDETPADSDKEALMSLQGLACFKSNKEDNYLKDDDDSDDADEDLEIQADDNLILMGKFQQDFSALNVYVYNDKSNYLYCHHDSLLLGFPLCMEWMDFDPGEESPGNLVAIGYMQPDIEIWDVDVLDSVEPAFVLKGSKKKKKKIATGHTDAVLDLSWNSQQRNVLASASADQTVGLWDLTKGKIVVSIDDHDDKVQAVKWHPQEAQTLLTGGFDKTAKLFDCRCADKASKMWKLKGEVEKVTWDSHNPFFFLASTDNGYVQYFDTRKNKSVFTLQAHEDAVCGLSLSPATAGCLVTASPDKLVKVWDIREKEPVPVFSKEMQLGELHSLSPCPDFPLVFAVGGEKEMRVLNLQKQEAVTSHFKLEYLGKTHDEWELGQSDESEEEDDDDMDPKKMLKARFKDNKDSKKRKNMPQSANEKKAKKAKKGNKENAVSAKKEKKKKKEKKGQ